MKFLNPLFSVALVVGLSIGVVSAQTFVIDPAVSSVKWTGSKVIGGSHNGSVKLASGKLVINDGDLSDGSFATDMSTITVEDLTGGMADKLSGHLFSDDFFGVKEHASSSFFITSVEKTAENSYTVTGDLYIKGQKNAITFPASLSWENGVPVATATVKVDRTKFGIRYGSDSFFDNLGDKAIANEFELQITLVGSR